MREILIRIFCKSMTIIQWSAMLNASRSETGCEVFFSTYQQLTVVDARSQRIANRFAGISQQIIDASIVPLRSLSKATRKNAAMFKTPGNSRCSTSGLLIAPVNLCDILQAAAQPARLAR